MIAGLTEWEREIAAALLAIFIMVAAVTSLVMYANCRDAKITAKTKTTQER